MANVTQILSRIESGDPTAAEQLLPLVYDELRKLAAQRLTQEKPGQTLQATALRTVFESDVVCVELGAMVVPRALQHSACCRCVSCRRRTVTKRR
jgi:hypothetical protein